jgi:hypothetical protein
MTPVRAESSAFPPANPPRRNDLGTCTICYQPMTLIEDGQTTHPAGDIEVAVQVVRTVWPGAEVVGQWLTADELFRGSGQCKDCGDPLNQPGLMQRCRGRHQVMRA